MKRKTRKTHSESEALIFAKAAKEASITIETKPKIKQEQSEH